MPRWLLQLYVPKLLHVSRYISLSLNGPHLMVEFPLTESFGPCCIILSKCLTSHNSICDSPRHRRRPYLQHLRPERGHHLFFMVAMAIALHGKHNLLYSLFRVSWDSTAGEEATYDSHAHVLASYIGRRGATSRPSSMETTWSRLFCARHDARLKHVG